MHLLKTLRTIIAFFGINGRNMGNFTTVEADPRGAAALLRALKEKKKAKQRGGTVYEHREDAQSERPGWFQTSRDEVEEKLGRETIWDLGPSPRGKVYELLRNAYPANNLKYVDDIKLEARTVTGMKTIELRAPTYQDVDGLDRRVRECIDELSGYQGGRWKGKRFDRGKDFDDVCLEIGIPTDVATQAQIEKLLEMQDYAQTKDVTFAINEVP